MVKEYRKLSHSFEEFKAENSDLKNSSAEPSAVELGEADSLKIELSKLTAENELLREESSELKAEIETLNELVSSGNKSARSLYKLQESQKSVNDRTGLGFNNSEDSEGETSTQSQPAYDKFNKMRFVKANVIYDCCESMIYDDQTSQKLNHNGKAGIDFQKLENSKKSWLKNKLDKDKAKAGRKPFVPNQPWRSSTKVKSGWKKVQPKRDISGQSCQLSLESAVSLLFRGNAKTFRQSLATFRLLTVASSYYTNTLHVDFESGLAMDNPGMVSVFNALMASGLEGFLGCPAVLYEAALVDFFENGSVRDGLVVSTVSVPVEITEQLFAEAFELLVDGFPELSEIPKDKVFDARSLVSLTGELVSTSGKKSQMKIEYLLLCDIMAKTISETLNHIADQLSELIAYINRGGNDKKGEVSSSRPQPPPDDQKRGSSNAGGGGDNVRTTNIVDRYSGSMSREVIAEVEAVEDAVLVAEVDLTKENILAVLVGLSEDLLKTG
ncbi:putative leucine-rich repeat receptor-like protein kinase [Dorcoceras hygrometricum]|uniref:Putative leucine-rich repeat receptor-like protein kinase n=1 Tax=Dorcoceras hygrometricum TaxID=472368 RepID=A0A2Z7CQV1_9LAMI|nr:putative leucine-rich repeat receptor-like protein kinase [Dorcoceras hygrometricum]